MAEGKKLASASRPTSKKRTGTMMNADLVSRYLIKLQAALGDDNEFIPIFQKLASDSEMQQCEAVELANRFVAKTSASTSRAKALERILKRHTSLASFRLKQRAMAGRSAA